MQCSLSMLLQKCSLHDRIVIPSSYRLLCASSVLATGKTETRVDLAKFAQQIVAILGIVQLAHNVSALGMFPGPQYTCVGT